jgi:hypothetical protein
MSDPGYPACIRELYEGEIFGEAAFGALVNVGRTSRERYHFGTLLQLETETKARLRPFLLGHGIALSETTDLSGLEDAAAGYLALSWADFAAANIPTIETFLARFREIAALGPAADQPVLQSMIVHELAFLRWLQMEAAGDTKGSLDDVIALLQYPLPVPAEA